MVQPARRRPPAPCPSPAGVPLAPAAVCQVIKTVRRRRLVRVTPSRGLWHRGRHRALCWQCALAINTAFVERVNLTIRQHVACGGTAGRHALQGRGRLPAAVTVYHVYYNFCLPHASLRHPLPQPQATMAKARQSSGSLGHRDGGRCDEITSWTLRECCSFRVPPWPQVQPGSHEEGGGSVGKAG